MIMLLLSASVSDAEIVQSAGSAVIEKGDMRSAYKNALDNAIIGAVRAYYKSKATDKMPDISPEYIKFVKGYKILSRSVSGYTLRIRIAADLDNAALQDAAVFIDKPVNTTVFVFSGIPSKILPDDEQAIIIDKALASKSFSTGEQKNFLYGISDMGSRSQAIRQFKNVYSKYLFKFSFKPSFDNLSDPDNSCELVASTDIIQRDGDTRTLKIETSSLKANEKQCISDAMTKAVATTIDYARSNLIRVPEQTKRLISYKIKAINFKNMVGTNNFISTLKQRGLIVNYKAASFSVKEIVFQVESYFSEKELEEKLKFVTSDDISFTYSSDEEGIVLDFYVPEIPDQKTEVEYGQ